MHDGELVTIADAYAPLPDTPLHRPWITVSMVQSLDGATAFAGVSGPLGSAVDQAVFGTLRRHHDVSLVGAGTARTEQYKPLRTPGRRLAVVTASGNLPLDEPVYQHDQTLVVLPVDGPDLPCTTVRAGHGRVDLAQAVDLLQAERILLEGGSSLNGQMLALDLVDEVCLTLSPVLVGGVSPRVATFPSEFTRRFRLVHVLEADGLLFLRYTRAMPSQ
jgi:riboflavin biosynthesis pyrimidine reductase